MTKKNDKNVLHGKNIKITQGEHAFKGYVSNYNVKTLNCFNPKIQIKDT